MKILTLSRVFAARLAAFALAPSAGFAAMPAIRTATSIAATTSATTPAIHGWTG